MLAGIRYTECSGPPIGNGLVVRLRDDRWVSGALDIVEWAVRSAGHAIRRPWISLSLSLGGGGGFSFSPLYQQAEVMDLRLPMPRYLPNIA